MMRHGERLVVRPHTDPNRNVAHVMPVPIQPFTPGNKFTLLTDQKLDAGDVNAELEKLGLLVDEGRGSSYEPEVRF